MEIFLALPIFFVALKCDAVPVRRLQSALKEGSESDTVTEYTGGAGLDIIALFLKEKRTNNELPNSPEESVTLADFNGYDFNLDISNGKMASNRTKRHSRYRSSQFPSHLVVKFDTGMNTTGSAVVHPIMPTVSAAEDYQNQRGAMIFAVVVVSMYGLSIGLLIGSSMRRDEEYEEVWVAKMSENHELSWCQLCGHWWHRRLRQPACRHLRQSWHHRWGGMKSMRKYGTEQQSLGNEGCHDASFVVTGGTAGCRYDKMRCRH